MLLFVNCRVALLLLTILAAKGALAADSQPAAADFDKLYAEWKEVLADLAALQAEFQAVPANQRQQVQTKYVEAFNRGTTLAPKLQAAAEAAFLANPKNKEIGDLLLQMVVGKRGRDEYEETLRLAQLLIDNDYRQPTVYQTAGRAAFAVGDWEAARIYLQAAKDAGALDDGGPRMESIPKYEKMWQREFAFREAEAKADDLPRVKLATSKGEIVVELFENEAPNTVANFISLVEKGFYDGTPFHRVLPGFMAQGGDPEGTGGGGPGYTIKCECYAPNHREHFRGSLSMAKQDERDTGGSQFFLTFAPTPQLDGLHTVFGRVIDGIDVLAKLQRVDPKSPKGEIPDTIEKATVLRKRDHPYVPKKVGE